MHASVAVNLSIGLCQYSSPLALCENFVHSFDDQRRMRLLGRPKILLDAEVYLCSSRGTSSRRVRPGASGLGISFMPSTSP